MEFNFKNPKLELVFKYFEEISKIPRGSGNEKEISDYLAQEGRRLGLDRKSTRLNSSHVSESRMPSSA